MSLDPLKLPAAVIMLGMTTCGHCAEFRPVFEQVVREYPAEGRINAETCFVAYVDTDPALNELANRWAVGALPCTMFLLHGTPIGRLEGVLTAEQLRDRIRLLYGV